MAFWGINPHEKDCLYQWQFLPFGLKNALTNFQRVIDWMLAGLGFVECYIDDIIFLAQDQRFKYIICRRYLKDLRIITLSFIQVSANFSKHMWNTWVT
jgi:hypothetical protein